MSFLGSHRVPSHTFRQLASAIDDAFARWDRSHLYEFRRLNGDCIGPDGDDDEAVLDDHSTKLSRLGNGEQFLYVFDFGDDWNHLCTVAEERIDPTEVLGIVPDRPLSHWGWGPIPDQYGRRFDGDDGEKPLPTNPRRGELPPLLPHWGPDAHRYPD